MGYKHNFFHKHNFYRMAISNLSLSNFMFQEGVDRSTPLFNAVYANRPENCQELLKAGANVDKTDEHGYAPLYCAVLYKQESTVKVLLEAGADPNRSYGLYRSLLLCPSLDNSNCVEYLLKSGADVNVRTNVNSTVLHKCQGVKGTLFFIFRILSVVFSSPEP